jgi:protein-tyrosine phosphatase
MSGLPGKSQASVDLHSHVLPGIDDGAGTAEVALEMLRVAAADGTRFIVATPHVGSVSRQQILRGVETLNEFAQSQGVNISVLPGSEVRLTPAAVTAFADGQLMTLNQTSYLLIELPLGGPWPPQVAQVVFDLQMAGASPVLAHAERYHPLRQSPELLVELVRAGVVVQINASSLLGQGGERAQRAAEQLVRSRLAHVVASDAHDARLRPPVLSAAMRRVAELAGSEEARLMGQRAEAIMDGLPLVLPDPGELAGKPASGTRLLRRWFGRQRPR